MMAQKEEPIVALLLESTELKRYAFQLKDKEKWVVFVAISFKRQLTTKTTTHLSLANIAILALLTIISFSVSRTGIGNTPFMIFLGILILSIVACIQNIRHPNVEWYK